VLVVARFEPPEYSNLEDRLRQAFVHAGKYCERGPPFVTDDPEPPPPGGWEINIPFIIEHAAHGTEMDAPLFDLNCGLPNVQLQICEPSPAECWEIAKAAQ
jgi:hypothetical protein